jgi:hypothetical protein
VSEVGVMADELLAFRRFVQPFKLKGSKEENLRAAIESLRGEHVFEFLGYDHCAERVAARCMRCSQVVVADINSEPRPLFFGRSTWAPIRLFGLPTIFYCGYTRRMIARVEGVYR